MIGLIKGLPRKVNMAGSPQPIVTFTSNVKGLDIPEILAYIQATQAGTGDPSPSNPRVINGVSEVNVVCTGKNLANIFVDGKVPSTTTGALVNAGGSRTDFIKCFPSEKYTLSCSNSQALYVFYYDENKGFLNYSSLTGTALTVTTPLNAKYLMLRFGSNTVDNGMLEKGETATTFEPFGTTATTDLGDTYYGGYLNVTTGLLTVTHGYADLGSFTWDMTKNDAVAQEFRTTDFTGAKGVSDTTLPDIICSQEKVVTRNYQANNFPQNSIGITSTSRAVIVVEAGKYTNASTFKTAMNGVKLVYELATPQTYQLTPAQIEQLLGQNNVFCSSGDVEVTQIWARRDRSIISRG